MLLKVADFNLPGCPLPKLTIVFGQDFAFMQHVKNQLVEHNLALHPEYTRQRWHPEEDSWGPLHQSLQQLDLFYETSVHDIILTRKTEDKAALDFIDAVLSNNNSDHYVLSSTTLELKHIQQYARHNETLVCQTFTPSKTELLRHCQRSLFAEHSALAQDIAQTVYTLSQGNTQAYLKMLTQLSACKEAGEDITLALVKQLYPDQSVYSVQNMVDACLRGDVELGIKSMAQLCADRNNTALIIWVIAQELRNLFNTAFLCKTLRMQDSFDKLKIWPKKRPLYQAALNRLKLDDLQVMTVNLAALDEAFKTHQDEQLIQQGLIKISLYLAHGNNRGTT